MYYEYPGKGKCYQTKNLTAKFTGPANRGNLDNFLDCDFP